MEGCRNGNGPVPKTEGAGDRVGVRIVYPPPSNMHTYVADWIWWVFGGFFAIAETLGLANRYDMWVPLTDFIKRHITWPYRLAVWAWIGYHFLVEK